MEQLIKVLYKGKCSLKNGSDTSVVLAQKWSDCSGIEGLDRDLYLVKVDGYTSGNQDESAELRADHPFAVDAGGRKMNTPLGEYEYGWDIDFDERMKQKKKRDHERFKAEALKKKSYFILPKTDKGDSEFVNEWELQHLRHFATSNRGLGKFKTTPDLPERAAVGREITTGLEQGIGEDTILNRSSSSKNKRGRSEWQRLRKDPKVNDYVNKKVTEIENERLEKIKPSKRRRVLKEMRRANSKH